MFVTERSYFSKTLDESLQPATRSEGSIRGDQDGGRAKIQFSIQISDRRNNVLDFLWSPQETSAPSIDEFRLRKSRKVPLVQEMIHSVGIRDWSNGYGINFLAFMVNVDGEWHEFFPSAERGHMLLGWIPDWSAKAEFFRRQRY
jgi:hypothetical protein